MAPQFRWWPKAATTLGMVFHELATNAAKYGALSQAGGQVEVTWTVLDATPTSARLVRVRWTERGGPRLEPARAGGFGTQFITRSVCYELAGNVVSELEPEGLRCTIEFPTAGSVLERSEAIAAAALRLNAPTDGVRRTRGRTTAWPFRST